MEVEMKSLPQNNFGIVNPMKEAVFYDIITNDSGYPICSYSSTKQEDLNVLNNNNITSNSDTPIGTIDVSLQNMNVMPPPPQKIIYNSTMPKKCDSIKPRENYYRPISPKEYDSDESNNSSNATTPDNNATRAENGLTCINGLGEQTLVFGNIYQMGQYYQQNNQYQSQFAPNSHQNGTSVTYTRSRYQPAGIQQQQQPHPPPNHATPGGGASSTPPTTANGARQKHYRPHHTSDVMIRRAHGLVERFRSRARLLKIDPHPAGLLTGGPWDTLSQAIWDVYSSKAQKEDTYEQKITLWKRIFLYIRRCLSSYGLFMVGSTMSGFGLETSDIDMCLLTKPCTSDPRMDSLQHLNSISSTLVKCGVTSEPELILAKVPILKFRDRQTGFEVDLNCNNAVGIRNTHLLHCYARLDWRVRPLVVMVKLWAQANGINDAKNLTVSSYSWALMVMHYLQCGASPPVLPCLHTVVPDIFNTSNEHHSMDVQEEIPGIDFKSDNTLSLGELLIGFFHYYSIFNYNQFAVSVRTGCRLPIDECRNAKAPKNDPHQWKYLCIEEPFDLTNTARSVYDIDAFKHIKHVIMCSYHELAQSKILSNILPVTLNLGQR